MAHGKPCIAANSGGAPEVVTPASGLLVPYADVPALATACVTALTTAWNAETIHACAHRFSYPVFREHLNRLTTQ
jgi:glycosyltransferase involved in cell wall biosynthesis